MKSGKILIILLLLLSLTSGAQEKTIRLAMLEVDNLSMDPRADYIEGIIRGVLLFDLARAVGIEMVDRASLEKILKEQELQLNNLVNQSENAVKVGKVLGAQYLIKGEYVFLGDEVMVNIHILNVETSKLHALSNRGRTENLIHGFAEDIIEILTGHKIALQAPEHERSIISLKDEKPGSLTLHCYLQKGEVYIDEVFKGFTPGDETIPQKFTDIKPGKHKIRIYAWGEYGIIKEPEITFHDWSMEFDLKPGENLVVRARPNHYSFALNSLMSLLSERERFQVEKKDYSFENKHEAGFMDRQGKKIDVKLLVKGQWEETLGAKAEIELIYNGKKKVFNLSSLNKKTVKKEFVVDKITLILTLDMRYKNWKEFSYRLNRNDINSSMWRKK